VGCFGESGMRLETKRLPDVIRAPAKPRKSAGVRAG
jgi:hypothetical protein